METENCKIYINFHSWDIWHLLWELISHIFFERGCPDGRLSLNCKEWRRKQMSRRLSQNRSEWSTKQRKQDHHYQSLRVIGRNWLGDHECQGSESPRPSSPLGIIILILPFKITWYYFCLPFLGIIILILTFETIKNHFCFAVFGHHHPYLALWDNWRIFQLQ